MSQLLDEYTNHLSYTEDGWRSLAACAEAGPQMFFSDGGGNQDFYARARAVCASCPVREDCLRFACKNNIVHGMWGGTTPHERRKLKRLPEYAPVATRSYMIITMERVRNLLPAHNITEIANILGIQHKTVREYIQRLREQDATN